MTVPAHVKEKVRKEMAGKVTRSLELFCLIGALCRSRPIVNNIKVKNGLLPLKRLIKRK